MSLARHARDDCLDRHNYGEWVQVLRMYFKDLVIVHCDLFVNEWSCNNEM
jgi:hypothetical protein